MYLSNCNLIAILHNIKWSHNFLLVFWLGIALPYFTNLITIFRYLKFFKGVVLFGSMNNSTQ